MSTVTVYKNKDEVFYNTIHQEFHIWEDTAGRLCWDETENVNGPGVIKVWLQVVGSTPRIPFVLPDWQLIVDGLWMEKKFYPEVEDLQGREVELQYNEYRFVFQFD